MIQIALLGAGGFALGHLARDGQWDTLGIAAACGLLVALVYAIATRNQP